MIEALKFLSLADTLIVLASIVLATYVLLRLSTKPGWPMVLAKWLGLLALFVLSAVVVIAQWPLFYGALEQLRFLRPRDILVATLDISIVAFVLYKFFMLIKGTRAIQLIKGVMVLLIATTVSQWLGLVTINWLLRNTRMMLFVALPVVFQPELRRALEQIGRGRFFARSIVLLDEEEMARLIGEVVRAAEIMSRNKIGALVVIERETGLGDFIETGIRLDAVVSGEFLVNIFIPNTPLHDGAVIIRGDRVMAAACFLPLSESPAITPEMGGRHRAALGISEHSDALAIVVSEETGNISLAQGGKLIRNIDSKTLSEMLGSLCQPKHSDRGFHFWNRG